MKTNLTDKKLRSLRPRATPFDVMDDSPRGFGVRVMTSGDIIFMLYRIFPGSKKARGPDGVCKSAATRRKIGRYGNPLQPAFQPEMSLQDARDVAGTWLNLIRKGVDPGEEAARERKTNIEASRVRHANKVSVVLDAYLAHKSNLRTIRARGHEMKRELKPWLDKSLTDISEDDVIALIAAIKARGAGGQARQTLLYTKAFFSWAVDSRKFGLKLSPCMNIKISAHVDPTGKIERHLEDHEIAAYLRACDVLGYPWGAYFRLLLMSGLRRVEAAKASWPEFKREERRWVVPATRMKGRNDKAKAHLVPLTGAIEALLDTLPQRPGYLFSNNGGTVAIANFSKMKLAIDKIMKAELQKEGYVFRPWRIHDTRRTFETKLASLGVSESLIERLVGHAMPELSQRYNMFKYEFEKREALERWHLELGKISHNLRVAA